MCWDKSPELEDAVKRIPSCPWKHAIILAYSGFRRATRCMRNCRYPSLCILPRIERINLAPVLPIRVRAMRSEHGFLKCEALTESASLYYVNARFQVAKQVADVFLR